jgi:muramoyltetrapeptide carboxypeptidase
MVARSTTSSPPARGAIKFWQPLRRGALVDLVAPGSGCDAARLAAGIAVIESWGLRVRVPAQMFDETPFVAHNEATRWRQLRGALRAPDSDAVWCVRGGYGCMHLTPRLAAMAAPPRVKPLIGFSDITALLNPLAASWGWASIHGPVVAQLSDNQVAPIDLKRLRELLFGRLDGLSFARLRRVRPGANTARAAATIAGTSIEGRLMGGNLATLQSLVGNPGQASLRGSILFLEDVNERGYTVDRMLRTLQAGGALRGVRAVVLGEFLRADEANGTNLVSSALENLARRLRCPVYAGVPAGHGRRLAPLVIGAQAVLTIARGGAVLSYKTPFVQPSRG